MKIYLGKLIDRLASYDLFQDEENPEMTEKDFLALSYTFEPLNNILFRNPPDNLSKLYDLLMVKISDIQTLNLAKCAEST